MIRRVFDIKREIFLFVIVLVLCSCSPAKPNLLSTNTISLPPAIYHSPTVDTTDTPLVPTKKPTRTVRPTMPRTVTSTPTPIAQPWRVVENWTPANQVRKMLFDRSGRLWSAGPGGVVAWDVETGKPTIFTMGVEPDESRVTSIVQASDQSIWIGTDGHGLSRYENDQWKIFTTQSGLPSNTIYDLAYSNGSLWVDASDDDSSRGWALGNFDGTQWNLRDKGTFDQIFAAPDGSIWAIWTTVVSWRKDSDILRIDPESGKWEGLYRANSWVTAITFAPNGVAWMATKKGLYWYSGEKHWQRVAVPWAWDGTMPEVSTLAVTEDGTVWVGFSNEFDLLEPCGDTISSDEMGVYRYDGKLWKHYTTQNGLNGDKVCDIQIGPDGDVWVGTFDQGISRFDGENWTSYVIQ